MRKIWLTENEKQSQPQSDHYSKSDLHGILIIALNVKIKQMHVFIINASKMKYKNFGNHFPN